MFLNNAYPPWVLPKATYRLSFVGDRAAGTFTRASAATRINHRGYLEEVASNVRRADYNPALAYNHCVNPWGDGAVVGGSLPTAWSGVAGGLTAAIADLGTNPDGTPYIEYTITGTSNGNAQVLRMGTSGNPPLVPSFPSDGTWSCEMGIEVLKSDGVSLYNWIASQTAAGSTINSNAWQGNVITAGTPYARYSLLNRALTNVNTAGVEVGLRVTIPGGPGTVVDARVRLSFPVLFRGATLAVPLATVLTRINGLPAYGLRGLLLEEAATNLITNSNMTGAVVGTFPSGTGTLPTGWTTTALVAGVAEVIRVTSEAGYQCVDVRFNSASALSVFGLNFSGFSSGFVGTDSVSQSVSVRLIAGSLSGVTIGHSVLFSTDGGSTNTGLVTQAIVPTSAPLSDPSQRTAQSRTATTGVTHAQSRLRISSSGACDFTLRIAAPQFEKAAQPSSFIPTTTAQVTRARDGLTLPAGLNGARMTFLIRYAPTSSTASGTVVFLSQSGSASDCYRIFGSPPQAMHKRIGSAQTVQFNRGGGAPVAGQFTTAAMSVGDGISYGCWDGGSVAVDNVIGADLGTLNSNRVNWGQNSDGPGMWLDSFAYWPVALTPEQLQQITALS